MKRVVLVMIMVMAVMAARAQRATIKVGDLPKAISEYITKDYPGYSISNAWTETKNNMMSYEVMAVKGSMKETLVFDKDGKFLRKEGGKMSMSGDKNKSSYSHKKSLASNSGK